ncbi:protein IQ-DOMAIN 31 [Citrus sinensis]|nr:protein IQ-DOMAIN 31 [Citrus sinensis]
MLGLVKLQALVRGRKVRHSDVGLEVGKTCTPLTLLDDCTWQSLWNRAANADSITVHSTPKFERSKRSLKKALSHPADPVDENPQSELEKVKRSLRKVNNHLVENSAFVQSEFEIEKKNHSLDKLPTSSVCHEGLERSLRNSGEKMKKKTTLKQSKLPKVEATPDLVEMNEMSDVPPSDLAVDESKPWMKSGAKDETIPMTNGNFEPKEDSTNNENNKSSRKVVVLTKKKCAENELQSSPSLPSYIAATESAKGKLRLQGSSRSSEDGVEKNSGTGIRIGVGDSGFWQNVMFEKIPLYCASCKHLGHTIETCYVANPGLRPQRPSGNRQTRVEDGNKSEVLPSDTSQPSNTPRPEPSITKQIADVGSPITKPSENRPNVTNSTSVQEPIAQDDTTHDSKEPRDQSLSPLRSIGEYNPHLHRASSTDFRHYNSHTDNDDSSDEHLANNEHFLFAPENSERIDLSPDFSIVGHSKKGFKLLTGRKYLKTYYHRLH